MFQRVRLIRGIALAAISFGVPAAAFADHPWLDDANRRSPTADASLDKLSHGYPRVLVHEFVSGVSAEAYSKYDFVDAHGTHFETFETVQSKYDGTTRMLRHISGRAYQSYNFGTCVISSGIAFEATTSASQGGPKSAGCGIFAGHWLYKAGTTTRQSIAAGATTIPVNDPSRITQGSYVVIYDAPAGSFRNAEHARVTGVNKTNNTIQVARGFKSKAASHAAGSIVAEHVIGQGSDKQLWAFNMSSQSAQDANGKTFGEFYADWIGKNLEKYGTGQQTSADVAGVMFDADFYYELANTKSDANNDLVVDNGLAPNGTNWLGEGLDAFYARVSNRLPGKYLLTGVHDGRGYHAAHGTQMENWLDFGNGDFKPTPKYNRIPDLFATYLFNMADRSSGPPLVHNLSKTPTKLYPAKTGATSNAPFRLALALTLMDDGYFGTHSNVAADAWYDEYAVNVQKGSANYGAAIPKSNASQVRQNRGWLGNALGPFRRIYDDAAFAASKNLLNNGGFDGGINGWRTANVDLSRETSNAFEGSGALRISPMIKFHDDLGGATAKGPSMSVSGGQTYTVALALRSSAPRDVRVSLGDAAVRVPVGTKWRRYVLTLKPTKSSTSAVQINVGREETIVWADSIYVFKGADPNVFSREFENGMVVANATASSKTISVGSNFRRIKGNQDGTVNNGQNVTSVTLAPYDAVLLVRRESAASGSSTTSTTSGGDATSGSGSVGDLVWQDADGNGVKGASESGWSGVTVRLRECNGPILRSATTDAQGRYLFDTLGAGEYQVEVVLPSGAKHSPNGAGSDGSRDSDINPGTGLSWCTPITSKGENRLSLDAGLVPTSGSGGGSATAGGAALGDYVWHDLNGDGIQNNVEPGIAGVKIKLRDCNGIYHQTTFTDQAGNYSFANLAAGQYLVHFITPAGMQSSPAGIGKEGKDSDADGSGLSHCINLGQNDQRGGIDAGFH